MVIFNMNANFQMLEFPGVHKVNREIPKQKTQNKKGTREMKITMNRIKCEADRAYNKADDMHLMASIKNRMGQNLKPLLQPIALKKMEGDPDFDYVVEDGRRRFLALVKLNVSELEMGQDCILIDGDSEVNAYVANQHTDLSLAEEIKKLYSMREKFTTIEALAVEIGHSPTWVARRLNLLNLSELWKKAMAEKTFGYMTVAHYETIATDISGTVSEIIRAIESRNDAYLRKFPGIGTKASQQIILDLRGKLSFTEDVVSTGSGTSSLQDVEEALVALGYSKKELTKVLSKLDATKEVGDLIKDALKILAK